VVDPTVVAVHVHGEREDTVTFVHPEQKADALPDETDEDPYNDISA
jgi:hypothetical protein